MHDNIYIYKKDLPCIAKISSTLNKPIKTIFENQTQLLALDTQSTSYLLVTLKNKRSTLTIKMNRQPHRRRDHRVPNSIFAHTKFEFATLPKGNPPLSRRPRGRRLGVATPPSWLETGVRLHCLIPLPWRRRNAKNRQGYARSHLG